jgi:hypothetical protein
MRTDPFGQQDVSKGENPEEDSIHIKDHPSRAEIKIRNAWAGANRHFWHDLTEGEREYVRRAIAAGGISEGEVRTTFRAYDSVRTQDIAGDLAKARAEYLAVVKKHEARIQKIVDDIKSGKKAAELAQYQFDVLAGIVTHVGKEAAIDVAIVLTGVGVTAYGTYKAIQWIKAYRSLSRTLSRAEEALYLRLVDDALKNPGLTDAAKAAMKREALESVAEFVPRLPSGMTNRQFGKIMDWGTGDAAARARIATLRADELKAHGITEEVAQEWAAFYWRERIRLPENPSAAGRADLMERAVELLRGGK